MTATKSEKLRKFRTPTTLEMTVNTSVVFNKMQPYLENEFINWNYEIDGLDHTVETLLYGARTRLQSKMTLKLGKIIKMTKRPFGFHYQLPTGEQGKYHPEVYAIFIKKKEMCICQERIS
ncbi:MAG: hypothetical protein KGM99_13150 [Burkholderiales bacterium]|nr:hypothetical protein [Burkholderiales bacterium]